MSLSDNTGSRVNLFWIGHWFEEDPSFILLGFDGFRLQDHLEVLITSDILAIDLVLENDLVHHLFLLFKKGIFVFPFSVRSDLPTAIPGQVLALGNEMETVSIWVEVLISIVVKIEVDIDTG